MDNITIPPKVIELAASELWTRNGYISIQEAREQVEWALRKALAAWPDATMYGPHSSGHGPSRLQLVLPIQEARDD